ASTQRVAMSWRGRLAWYRVDFRFQSQQSRSQWYSFDHALGEGMFDRRPHDRVWKLAGFAWYRGDLAEGMAIGGPAEMPYWRIEVPYWAIVTIFAAWPAWTALRWYRRRGLRR